MSGARASGQRASAACWEISTIAPSRLLRDLGYEKPLKIEPEVKSAKRLRREWRAYRKAERAWA
jgi:hypothetical protein